MKMFKIQTGGGMSRKASVQRKGVVDGRAAESRCRRARAYFGYRVQHQQQLGEKGGWGVALPGQMVSR